ncbi:ABC transporter substrate-binding protein [Paenibacillus sp. Soil787]|uniref:ABC transporter substrate-binding protein n=1 Tax=Paenibacillus sp. Soil787 TaxID=1736411 RepID=UPI0006F819CF|nr:extracellular solute-binding protein [Paenibacillus sp. Soil787]KRF43822.1 hypothetical protein ASG93_02585 [Paenibacillus sp. Soil787]
MMKRKQVSVAVGSLLIMSMALSACGTKQEAQSTASVTPSATAAATQKPAEKVTLRISAVYTPEHPFGPAIAQTIDEFTKKHPEVTVEKEFAADPSQKLKVDLASDNLPEIFTVYGLAADNDYVKNKKILELTSVLNADSKWKDGFIAGALDNYKLGTEGYYAAPIGAFVTGFYYNKELFQKAGVEPPKTWNELLAVINKLNGSSITPWSLAAETWRTEHLFTAISYKLNGTQLSKDLAERKLPYNSPQVIDVFSKMKDLVDAGAFGKNYIGGKYAGEIADFNNGKAAMRYSGSWTIGESTGKDAPAGFKDKVGFFPFPYFEGKEANKDTWMGGTSDAFAISSKVTGHQKDMAIELVKALTSTATSKLIQETAHDLTAVKADVDPAKAGPLVAEVSKAMSTGKTFAGDAIGPEPVKAVNTKFYDITLEVFGKHTTPQDAVKQMDDAIAKNK